MAHVVCEPCAMCEKDRTAAPCALACPAGAILVAPASGGAPAMAVIDPVACTDCRACVPVCPARAVFHEDIVPDEWRSYILINYLRSTDPTSARQKRPAADGDPSQPCGD